MSKEEREYELPAVQPDADQIIESEFIGKRIQSAIQKLPLHFRFCDNPGLALPLIALQYHNVDFRIHYRALKHLVVGDCTVLGSPTLVISRGMFIR